MPPVTNNSKSFTIWMDPKDHQAFKTKADELAIPPATLARSILARYARGTYAEESRQNEALETRL